MKTRRFGFGTATLSNTRVQLVNGRGRVLWALATGGAAAESLLIGDRSGVLLFPAGIPIAITASVPLGPFEIENGLSAITADAAGDVGIFGVAEIELD